MADVSVVIVNWNTREYLRDCLASLRANSGALVLEVIVVENASGDGSAEMVATEFPEVQLIEPGENTGYARGNNIGLEHATAPLVLLLNPDIVVQAGSIERLVELLEEHPQAAAAAPLLRQPDGSIQHSCRSFPDPVVVFYEALMLRKLFPKSRRFGKYTMSWWDYGDTRMVDQPMASAFLMKRAVLDEVGVFDEGFPVFFNDVDLCKRFWDAGWEIWFTSDVEMLHEGGASTRQRPLAMIRESHLSMIRYYDKHYRGKVSWLTYTLAVALLRGGMYVRLALRRLSNG